MVIDIDLVPAICHSNDLFTDIAKTPRHGGPCYSVENVVFHRSEDIIVAHEHISKIYGYVIEMIHGYIIAKSLRLASICFPRNIHELSLCEDIDSQDIISSFALKQCLLSVGQRFHFKRLNPYEIAFEMYKFLEERVRNRESLQMTRDLPICFHKNGDVKNECCLKRKVILALCREILQWLEKYRTEFKTFEHEFPEMDSYR